MSKWQSHQKHYGYAPGLGRPSLRTRMRLRSWMFATMCVVVVYYFVFYRPPVPLTTQPRRHPITKHHNGQTNTHQPGSGIIHQYYDSRGRFVSPPPEAEQKPLWEITAEEMKNWRDPTDGEDPNDVELGYETDGKFRGFSELANLQHEKDMRKEWRHAYSVTARHPTSNLIYGNTLATLEHQEDRIDEYAKDLEHDPAADVDFSAEKPVRYNPYPDYNSKVWTKAGHARYVSCNGANGEPVKDLLVFKGQPREWPQPKLGSYEAMNMDGNVCWERETRLGPYGLTPQFKKRDDELVPLDWDSVRWGDLQRSCVYKNARRFGDKKNRGNEYLNIYPEVAKDQQSLSKRDETGASESEDTTSSSDSGNTSKTSQKQRRNLSDDDGKEKRTAVLLRSFSGKTYTENDIQNIRSLVTELSLRSGGEYEVFLLVQVKDTQYPIFEDPQVYQAVIQQIVPREFWDMTILWDDQSVWKIYPNLPQDARDVHTAQWLSVQKFSMEHPEFDFVWNWEMDFRFSGHHYELLDKMGSFAKKQPRRGLWERSERYYIPDYHGDYDTDFRKEVEMRSGNDTVWGPPPDLPFIKPVGPKPPSTNPEDDNYRWGVGEDADLITVGPIFNPINSNWVIGWNVWGYNDEQHPTWQLPRRTTIVTQARLSRRLLNIMHVENLRGNHIASEMTPQTVSLLHGLKAVYAPHPVFMDRDWDGDFLNRWFNPGEKGESGGRGSPMGWGRERRYQGVTWYYRAVPPNRLFNNWMGWVDTGIGGPGWEDRYGRPCLPPVMLHQVKNTQPTNNDHQTQFDLSYG